MKGKGEHEKNQDFGEQNQGSERPKAEKIFVIVGSGAKQAGAGLVAGRRFGITRDAKEALAELAEGSVHEGAKVT